MDSDFMALCAVLGVFLIPFILLVGVIAFICLAGYWKLFKKAGIEGWKCLIPFYNKYLLFTKIAGLHWVFSAVLIFISVFSINNKVIAILCNAANALMCYNLAKKFNRDPVPPTIIGLFASGIIVAVYGFSKDHVYDPNVEVSNVSLFSKL